MLMMNSTIVSPSKAGKGSNDLSSSALSFSRELGQNDVLLGRGTGPNEHIGNVRYRALVRDILKAANFSSASDGQVKLKLAKQIVDEVQSRGGKFVKRLQGGKKANEDFYVQVPWKLASKRSSQ